MQGEAQDIHKSGAAGMDQLFQDCVEKIHSLILVLIFIPLCFLTSTDYLFLSCSTKQIRKKRNKMHWFSFFSSICSKQTNWQLA